MPSIEVMVHPRTAAGYAIMEDLDELVRRLSLPRDIGSGGRTRTYDQAVNSRPLYH